MKKAAYRLGAVFSTSFVCFVVWLGLTWSLAPTEVIPGAVLSVLVGLFTARFFIHDAPLHLFCPARFAALLWYCVDVFIPELLKANWAMAKLVFARKIPVTPGIVFVPTALKSEYGLAMLANAITLTPGTITMDVARTDEGHGLYIHWIADDGSDAEAAGESIKGRLERGLGRVWR